MLYRLLLAFLIVALPTLGFTEGIEGAWVWTRGPLPTDGPGVSAKPADLTFARGNLQISLGCNFAVGSYVATGDSLAITLGPHTKMLCANMEYEEDLLARLAKVTGFAVGAGTLTLRDANGTAQILLSPAWPDEWLFYQLEVTNAGTRSQGQFGQLFDEAGRRVDAPAESVVSTPAGAFSMVDCTVLWKPCGALWTGASLLPGTVSGDALMDTSPWVFQLYARRTAGSITRWRGALMHGSDDPIQGRAIGTPLAMFEYHQDDASGHGASGWLPAGWQPDAQ